MRACKMDARQFIGERSHCAVLYPEGLSVIDNKRAVVMHGNRNEAFDLRVTGSEIEMTESGNDANS